MADFHYYTITIEATITVPAAPGGVVQTFNTIGLPAAAKSALIAQLAPAGAAITTPVVTLGTPVEVPAP